MARDLFAAQPKQPRDLFAAAPVGTDKQQMQAQENIDSRTFGHPVQQNVQKMDEQIGAWQENRNREIRGGADPGSSQTLGAAYGFARPFVNTAARVGFPGAETALGRMDENVEERTRAGQPPGTVGKMAGQVAASLPIMAVTKNPYLAGAGSGALLSEKETLPGVALDAGIGAVTGKAGDMVVGGAAKGLEKAFTPRPPAAASTASLRSQGDAMYDVAKNAGVVIQPARWANFVGDVRTKLGKMNPKLYPKATGLLEELDAAAKNPGGVTLEEADQLRQIAGDVLSNPEKGERRLAHIVIDSLDEYMDKLGPADVVTGDPKAATSILSQARDVWARKSKAETVDRLVSRAKMRSSQFSGSGYENALRTEFRSFSMNDRAMRRFNSAEQEAIRHVAKGGPVENVLRMVGKLAPTGVVSGVLGAGLGGATAGIPGAVGLPLAGLAARKGATMLTDRNAALASELMRRGGPAPTMPVNPTALEIANLLRGHVAQPAAIGASAIGQSLLSGR